MSDEVNGVDNAVTSGKGARRGSGASSAAEQPRFAISEGHVLASPRKETATHGALDSLMFGSVEYLCFEAEPFVDVEVIRSGTAIEPISFEWFTKNINVLAESYHDQSGQAIMKPGQRKCQLRIKVEDNDTWNIESTHLVILKNPSPNAILGEMNETSVIILNDDDFPSGLLYANLTEQGKIAVIRAFIKQVKFVG